MRPFVVSGGVCGGEGGLSARVPCVVAALRGAVLLRCGLSFASLLVFAIAHIELVDGLVDNRPAVFRRMLGVAEEVLRVLAA